MISCSHCGTQNRDGSKFCNNCGVRLATLTAAPTPEKTQGAPPIKGLSLPAKAPAPPTPPGPSTASESQVPEWARNRRASAPVEETPSAAGQPPVATTEPSSRGAGEVPEWLARLRAAPPTEEEETAPSAEGTPPLAAEEDPTWIRQLRRQTPAEEAPAAPMVEAEEPSWIKRMRAAPPVEVGTPTPAVEAEEPSWIKRMRAAPPVEVGAPTPVVEEVPDWLKELRARSKVKAEPKPAQEAHETQVAQGSEPLSESLEAVAPPAEEPQPPAWVTAAPEEETPKVAEMPDWMQPATPAYEFPEKPLEGPAEAAPLTIEPARPEEILTGVAALKPTEAIPPPSPVEFEGEPAETSGPLAGLRGVLPLAVAAAEPHPASKPVMLAERKDGAHLFDAILAEPAVEAEAPAAKKVRRVWVMRPLVYLLLALAVIIPFALPSNLAGATVKISHTPAAEFYDVIQSLPGNSTVLLAFDYDPSLAGEMDLQANAMVRDLVRRRVKIIALSTLETGPQLAQRILDPAVSNANNYRYGFDYLNLGYLPGHEAGLAQLAANGLPANAKDFVRGQPVGQFPIAGNMKTLREVALVIELAGSEEPLKMWMEQVQARANVRIAAGVSAAVEPKARAYRDAKQLVAMLSGLVGAAQYEVLSNQPGLAVARMNAQSAAQLVLVFIVVLGNMVYWISRARGKTA